MESTKIKHARRETGTVTVNGITSIILTIVALIGIISPFLHIFWSNSSAEGMFGFKYMSSFLYNIGLPMVSFSAGFLISFMIKFIPDSNIKIGFKVISFCFFYIGVFFTTWILMPKISDFSLKLYYVSLIMLSCIITTVTYLLIVYLFRVIGSTEKLITLIGNLRTKVLFENINDCEKTGNINSDRLIESFDKEVYSTLEEITKK